MTKTSLSMLIDKLEELCDSSTKIPVVGKILVDREDIYDLVDKMRTSVPESIRDAERVSGERDRCISEARDEARKRLESAEVQVTRMIKDSEIARLAEAEATRIVTEARQMAKELKLGASDYADGSLGALEQELEKMLRSLKKGREELKRRGA